MFKERFPQTVTLNGVQYTFRLMTAADREAILRFTQSLSDGDVLFMRRDVTQPDAIDAWIKDIEAGRAITILIEDKSRLVAYGSVYYNQLFWNRHLAELRILVSSPYRNRGLGTRLSRELIALARELELEKVTCYMAIEDACARAVVEDLGFRPEAVLADWVKTRDGRTHDLVIMSAPLSGMEW
jgi:RimJ/RimL family protein N-acetyltransferase